MVETNTKLDEKEDKQEENIVFRTEDPLRRQVILKETTWNYKILNMYGENSDCKHGNSHPEMKDRLQDIKKAVEKPHIICKDTKIINENNEEKIIMSDTRQEYFKFYRDDNSKLKAIKVIVDFSKSIGEVVTTHTERGSSVKFKGDVIYDSSEDK